MEPQQNLKTPQQKLKRTKINERGSPWTLTEKGPRLYDTRSWEVDGPPWLLFLGGMKIICDGVLCALMDPLAETMMS